VQTPKFTDAELAQIVRNACPASWKKAQLQANLKHLNLAAQTRFYTGLTNVEPNEQPQHCNKFQEKKSSNHCPSQGCQARNKSKPDTNEKSNNRLQKYCEIHRKCNHTTAQCEVIQKHQTKYQRRPSNKNNMNN
jgi:hypothetical protein